MKDMSITFQHVTRKIRDYFRSQYSPQTLVPLSRLCRSGRFTICKVAGDRKLWHSVFTQTPRQNSSARTTAVSAYCSCMAADFALTGQFQKIFS